MNVFGQVSLEGIIGAAVAIMVFFIFVEMFAAVTSSDNMLYDTLANTEKVPAHGATTTAIIYLVPLAIAMAIFIGIWRGVGRRPDYEY